jgi:SAM-dependent methyltransferase
MKPYTEDYYAARRLGDIRPSASSARVIVPLVLELVQPKSVIDVGCGTGEWLSVFEEHGVEDVWGVDGGWVSKEMLEIVEERFVPHDLEQPFHMDRTFDLVVSLEVAEHLPEECANTFVDSLTRLGPVVLFSAAIPHQGGRNHINEQWPEYWAQRFHDKDYVVIDCLRRRIWRNENVAKWYRQNILMFAAREHLEDQPSLSQEYTLCGTSQLSVVLPENYLEKEEQLNLEKLSPEKRSRLQEKQRKSQVSKLMKRNSKRVAQVFRLKKRNARLRARYSSRRYKLADVVAEKALGIPRGLLRSLKRRISA